MIDSLSGFEMALVPTSCEDFRRSLHRLVTALTATGISVLMTSKLEDRYADLPFSPYGTAFPTDALIVQRYIEIDSRLERVLAVVKVHTNAHSDELRTFTIDAGAIQIGAMPPIKGLLGGRPSREPAASGTGAGPLDNSVPACAAPRTATHALPQQHGLI